MLEKIQVDPYRRQQQKLAGGGTHVGSKNGLPSKRWFEVVSTLAQEVIGHLVFLAVAFFIGHGVLLGELHPFGVALVAASFVVYRYYSVAVLVGSIWGSLAITSGWEQAIYVITLVLVGMAALSLPPKHSYFRSMLGGVVFALIMLIGTIYASATYATTYDYMKVLFESFFAAFLAVAFYSALKGLQQIARGQQVAVETVFYLVLLLISIIAGAGQLKWWGVSPGGVLADLVVLLAAYMGRAGLGAAAGAVLGILPSMIYLVTPATLGVLAFAGFLGGLVRFLNRFGVVVGFMLGHALLTVYLGLGQDITTIFIEASVAALLFLMLPSSILMYWYKNISLVLPVTVAGVGVDGAEDTKKVAQDWQQAMADIADAAHQATGTLAQKPLVKDRQNQQVMLGQLKNMVCAGCVLNRACWDRDESLTQRHLSRLLAVATTKGSVNEEDMEQPMRLRCSRPRELVLTVNFLQQLNRQQFFWENKWRETQSLVVEQLQGLHQVMGLAQQKMLLNQQKGQNRAEAFKQALKQAGFKVAKLDLYPSGRHFELQVTMPGCHGAGVCRYDLAPVLTSLAGFPLNLGVLNCVCSGQEHFCSIRYYPGLSFSLKLGLAWSAQKDQHTTGDGYAVLPLSQGRVALMLSDGMGTGADAAATSGEVLTLLPKLLTIGFEPFLAVRMLNAMLAHRWSDDNYATLDLCVLDLKVGEIEIIKIGAAASFYLSQNKVRVFASESLPVGVVDIGSVFTSAHTLAVGDMLVMVTDGVIDVYRHLQATQQQPDWIGAVLEEIVDLPPQEIADLILKLAQSGALANGAADDMMVLVAQVTTPDPA